jgi:hypothetical protein
VRKRERETETPKEKYTFKDAVFNAQKAFILRQKEQKEKGDESEEIC